MTTPEKHLPSTIVLGTTAGKLIRFSFLHAHKPHMNASSGRHEYSTQVLIPKANVEDHAKIVAAIAEQQKILWPKGTMPPKAHYPLRDGDTGVDQKGKPLNIPGFWVLGPKTDAYERLGKTGEDLTKPNKPPGVVGTARDIDGKLKPLGVAEIKSGDWGRVSINVKSYMTGDAGVGLYLNNLQKVQDGEALGGGRKSAADEFADFADDEFDPLS